jgi:hypothetical protein
VPHVSVVVDLSELEEATPDLVSKARIEAAHVGRLSRSTVEQLLCDCALSRIITDGPSEVLDVGRASRTATPAQWRALVARDRHCTAPGCRREPRFCQAHHIVPWPKGGRTDLSNLTLLCWYHHRLHHFEAAHHRQRTSAA